MTAIPDDEQSDEERRVAPRMRVLKRGKVIFNNGFSTFDCVVRNVSATGALLTLAESAHLPKEFSIRIGEEKDARPAKLVYRRSMFAGIRFLDVAGEDEDASFGGFAVGQSGQADQSVSEAGGIRRIEPEGLPDGLTRHFAWRR
ncbi:PilZ domain-containing protein [Aurantimonas sp. VKM B-3413]|uniref:PilZ domain-containing protein n=1 Tax=Aurantimonas sp. VKM B-3413 TaxID=2779401 RepID=UPI001E6052E3|nr:PilZ domain-containing protein [Aurantimonas sp. VKM B-3413]MCB8838199.1 PilZ domain-containing protein [Aurantimonas sp. VKM B-3413]